ncbi:helix-turn-helix domain-containing protein [Ruminiclostridium hungatei]|uniref:helix-turn-helix domain-containing protein n=1 Tax=Ruminiclostridium hungatei TaxID=48256 RepID=UPI0013FD2E13|nr:helix-turn-helix transcriptional regulator [Ruminiclostridium hungatei]
MLQQKELAELGGISPSQISGIETGESKNITADTIAKLAKALNVSTDYILGITTVSVPKSYGITAAN